MCYESWQRKPQETDEQEKARRRASELIEQVRENLRRPKKSVERGAEPAPQTEETAA